MPLEEGCHWELVGKDWMLLEQDTVLTLEKGGVRPLDGRDGLCVVEVYGLLPIGDKLYDNNKELPASHSRLPCTKMSYLVVNFDHLKTRADCLDCEQPGNDSILSV